MDSLTYEYRGGELWVRVDGADNPDAAHARLLAALVEALSIAAAGHEGISKESYAALFEVLAALLPTATHLGGGWEAEAAKRIQNDSEA